MNNLCETDEMDYVVASDTDSVYINMEKFVAKMGLGEADHDKVVNFLDKAAEGFGEYIDEKYAELCAYMNGYTQNMQMGREVIASRGFWTAKKRYGLLVHDSEGTRYEEPKLKIMGLETVRSSTPAICRDSLEQAYQIILTGDNDQLTEFTEGFEKSFKDHSAESVAFPRGVNEIDKWKDPRKIYGKGTPIAVRGALLYNKLISEKKLNHKYEFIRPGDKIRFVYLKMPNPIKENVIAFPSILPPEFDLDDYVDYNKQLDKSFRDPLKTVLGVIGWNYEKITTLEEFFV